MKKMFFTAIALVAFSATSMANTVEVKKIVVKISPCLDWAVEQTNIDEEEFGCMTSAEYSASINSYVSKCNSH